jgi:hypothetical protein
MFASKCNPSANVDATYQEVGRAEERQEAKAIRSTIDGLRLTISQHVWCNCQSDIVNSDDGQAEEVAGLGVMLSLAAALAVGLALAVLGIWRRLWLGQDRAR